MGIDQLRKIRVLTIDDHPIFRQGIRHILEDESDIDPVGELSSVGNALGWLNANHADVVLLDHNLSGINGADAIPRLLECQSGIQIIMLTVSDDNDVFLTAIRNGACGYILKDTPPEQILEAIRAAQSGECRVSGSLVQALFSGVRRMRPEAVMRSPSTTDEPDISPREREILEQLVKGMSNKEIAKALDLSPNTIRNQLQRLQDIFGARNRVQLAILAYDAGIGGIS